MVDGDHTRYIGAVRRMIRAAGRRYGAADPVDLAELVELRSAVDDAIADAVRGQRQAGHSWQAIGDGVNMTKQAAQQRWGTSPRRPGSSNVPPLGDPFDELMQINP